MASLRSSIKFSSICIDEALAQFTGWMNNNSSKNPISPYLRGTFYQAVVRISVKEENKSIIDFFLSKYEEAKRLRFRHLEHFQRLRRAYVINSILLNKIRSSQKEETETRGFEMDEDTLCASVDGDKESFDTADIGIQALKRCWYKLKKKDDAPKKVKELVGEVLSKKEIESLENWEKRENTRGDVREAIEDLTEKGKKQLKCACMVANMLAKILE